MNLDQYQQKEMKIAKVYMHDKWAGNLTEDEDGYHFRYEKSYLDQPNSEEISVTFPLTSSGYESKILFPFFDGLIPEGWLLDIAQKNWKLDPIASAELFREIGGEFRNFRMTLATDYRIKNIGNIKVFYRFIKELNQSNPKSTSIVGLSFIHKLNF